jgi:hypothetical protein
MSIADDILTRARARRDLPPPALRIAIRRTASLSQEDLTAVVADELAALAPGVGITRACLARYEAGTRVPRGARAVAKAFAAFMATPRGAELHTAYAAASPAPVAKAASSRTKSEVFNALVALGREFAKREGVAESAAFNRVLETDEGRALHKAYQEAPEPAAVMPVAKKVDEAPAQILGRTINDEVDRLAKSDGLSIPEAYGRFAATPAGQLLLRGHASAMRRVE